MWLAMGVDRFGAGFSSKFHIQSPFLTVCNCRTSLMEGGITPVETSRTKGMDNSGLVNLQRQIMKGKQWIFLFEGILRFFLKSIRFSICALFVWVWNLLGLT